MRRQSLLLAGGLILGLFGAALVLGYVKSVERRAPSSSKPLTVFVATRTIPAGTPGSAVGAMVRTDRVPARYAPPQTIVDLRPFAEQFTTAQIEAGETLTASRFAAVGASRGRLPIPAGHEAAAVQVPLDSGVALYARPGDHVNVYAVRRGPRPGSAQRILVGVEVLATQASPGDGPAPARAVGRGTTVGNLMFVLAVTREEAARLIDAKVTSTIWLTLVPQAKAAS